MDAKATGCLIAKLRKQKGLTQKELAEKLSVTDKAISRWETGKGMPDPSLLAPLAAALGISADELLAGECQQAAAEARPEQDFADTFRYIRDIFAKAFNPMLILIGAVLVLAPLFVTAGSVLGYWAIGLIFISTGSLRLWLTKKHIRLSSKACRSMAAAAGAAALGLELLPTATAMIFADGPDRTVVRTFSCFSLIPLGYANFSPMLTGILTAVSVFTGIILLLRRQESGQNAVFFCTAAALIFSLLPMWAAGISATGFAITAALTASALLQAAAVVRSRKKTE